MEHRGDVLFETLFSRFRAIGFLVQHADFVSNNPFAATRLLGKTQEYYNRASVLSGLCGSSIVAIGATSSDLSSYSMNRYRIIRCMQSRTICST